ncbi:MAG: MATE family efflux transporter [Provencibacterium sp.]|jgi:multidrug efflux pump|nr:MATE family efflux transporter [Provencibacterium sp.]
MEDRKTYLFERAPISNAVFSMAVPTVLSSLVMVIYSLADTYFVGILNDPIQNAAVTLASPILLAFNAVNNLFGVGSSSMMSRSLGKKEYETVRKVAAFGFYCSLCCGLLFSLFYSVFRGPLLTLLGTGAETFQATAGYLKWTVALGAAPAILNVVMAYMVRSEGSTLHASIGTMSGCVLNILLDPIFILPWGLDMGAAGAGCATFLSNCAACVYFFVLLLVKRKSTYVSIHPRMFRPNKEIVLGVCGVGLPASIQNLLNVTGMTVLNNFTSGFGPDAVAAMGIAYKVYMVPMQISMGFSQGIMPLISYNYAAGNYRRMKRVVGFSARITLSFMAAIAAGYFIGASFFIRLFIQNADIVAYGTSFLRAMCLALPFINMDFLAVGIFQAMGRGRNSFLFAILRKILLEIPALYVLNYFFPLYGLPYAQVIAEFILAIAAVLVLRKIYGELADGDAAEESGGAPPAPAR